MTIVVVIAAGIFLTASVVRLIAVSTSAGPKVSLSAADDDNELLDLAGEKRAALRALKATEHDFEVGKVSESEYQELKQVASTRAIRIIRELDQMRDELRYTDQVTQDLDGSGTLPGDLVAPSSAGDDAGWLIADGEANPGGLSAAALLRHGGLKCGDCGARADRGAKFCDECGASLTRVCAACAHVNTAKAKFCAECGTKVVTIKTSMDASEASSQ